VALLGIDGHIAEVEPDGGPLGFHLVGLPDAALHESKDRARAPDHSQLRDERTQGPLFGGPRDERRLGGDVLQHPGGHRAALRLVSVQQAGPCSAAQLRRQLPAQVHRVLNTQVQTLAACREVDVGGVAGEEDPAHPVSRREP
jgi:hypothetical protein